MNIPWLRSRGIAFFAAALLVFSGAASADPPSRVARMGTLSGAISLSPAGEDDWVRATSNRPLTRGDRLWSDAGARAEIQIGGAMVRVNERTGLSVLNLDDRIAQLQLTQGTLSVNVRRLAPGEVFEVDTPNLALTLSEPGAYRIEVDPDGDTTTIVMRRGQGEVYGENASYAIDSRQPYRFTGTDLREYGYLETPRLDDFDRWAAARDRAYDSSPSARYVSRDVVGYQDLDANGSWRVHASYGNVWTPNRVPVGWAPYRDGHWAWIDPWGWTWIDDAPWGFAVSHYGRWANFGGSWGWIPGPVNARAYYAPALVVFVGGANFQLSISSGNVGGVGWFPLAPREVYRPSYVVSRGYFENVNRSNTVVNNTVINNTYNQTTITNIVYANQRVPGAVVAVPTNTFVQSQPVSRAAVRVTPDWVARAPVVAVPKVAPTERSVRGPTGAGEKPPQRVFERRVVARSAPPAAPIGFEAQQSQLEANPGRPLDDAARKATRPSTAAQAPAVKLVAPAGAQADRPTARPPGTPVPATTGRGDERRAQDEGRDTPAAATAPPVRGEPAPRPQATPPSREAQVAEPRGAAEPRNRADSPGQRVAPPPQRTPEPTAAAPQATPPTPPAQREEPRGKAEPRGNAEPRGQSVMPPAPPPQRSTEPTVAAPQATPPAPAVPRAEPRGKPEPRANAEPRGPGVAPPAPTPAPPPAPPQRTPEPAAAAPQATAPAPATQRAEPRGKSEQRGNSDPRGQDAGTSPRAAEPKAAPPTVTRPAPAPGRPEPAPDTPAAPAAQAAPPRPPVAAPKAPPPQAQPAASRAESGAQNPRGGGKSGNNKKGDEPS